MSVSVVLHGLKDEEYVEVAADSRYAQLGDVNFYPDCILLQNADRTMVLPVDFIFEKGQG